MPYFPLPHQSNRYQKKAGLNQLILLIDGNPLRQDYNQILLMSIKNEWVIRPTHFL